MVLKLTLLQLKMINTCRMYLKITILTEITDHTGTQLLPQANTCSKDKPPPGLNDISHSLLEWPVIHPPPYHVGRCGFKLSKLILLAMPRAIVSRHHSAHGTLTIRSINSGSGGSLLSAACCARMTLNPAHEQLSS